MAPSGQLNETINFSHCLSLDAPTTPLQIRPYEAGRLAGGVGPAGAGVPRR